MLEGNSSHAGGKVKVDGSVDKETGNAGECHSDRKSLPERAGVCSLCTPGEEKAISVHPICTTEQ